MDNKKPRAPYGSFYLTPEDVASFRQKKESARAITKLRARKLRNRRG